MLPEVPGQIPNPDSPIRLARIRGLPPKRFEPFGMPLFPLSMRFQKRRRRVILEYEAVGSRASGGMSPKVRNGVGQSANPPDDGHGAIVEAVHLIQPARFESRGHDEEITTSLDALRQALVEADTGADFRG